MRIRWLAHKRQEPNALQALILRLVLIGGAATMIIPFLWMCSTALKDDRTWQNDPSRWLPPIAPYVAAGGLALDWLCATTEDFENVLLDDFEDGHASLPVSGDAARAGRSGLLLRYDFAGQNDRQPAGVRVPISPPSDRTDRAVQLSFWLRGDGSGHALYVRLSGEDFTYESTEPLAIDFEGWKEVYCFLCPERFDPLGRAVIQMRRQGGPDAPVPIAALRAMELRLDPVSRAGQVWGRLTYSFRHAWNSMPFGRFYLNSIFIAVAVTIGQVTTSALAAYAFARLEFRGRDPLFVAYLATMMIPGAALIVPTFLLMRWLGWFDTYRALIIPAMCSAYGTFMLRQFFKTLPRDLEDAAKIDGCGKLRVWLHVILPLSKPALATLATFTFLGAWEAFQWPLFATKSMHMRVLQVGLSAFQDKFDVQYNLLMAAALIVMIPTLAVFLFNQRFFTRGVVLSGMKE